ncbi:MAG: S8 family serine peptidase [Candidatus Cloacimonetes bacterium]|nr:S8 family serine peptidase [Candidatus Cloacimonadota bacterium]
MKRLIFFLILFLLINSIFATGIILDSHGRKLYASDRIKVKLNEEASEKINALLQNNEQIDQTGLETLDALNVEYDVTKIILAHRPVNDKVWEQQTGFARWYLFFVPEKTDIEDAIKYYKNNEYVEFANPEYIYYLSVTPDDPYFDDCWGHDNTELNGPGSGQVIGFDSHIEEAWDDDQGYGNPDIIIAIIDSGVDYNHEDLIDNCVPGYDYGDNDDDPMDDSFMDAGHGTCCAGIAAAAVDNGIGISGVAGGCSIMPLKISPYNGAVTQTIINNALTHCGDYGVDIASMSFGFEGQQGSNPSADAAIAYAYDNGVTLLACTQNFNEPYISHPANDEHVIAVGAASPCAERKSPTSCDGQMWWGSSYGVDIQDARDAVDLVAPTILPTTDVIGVSGFTQGDYFMLFAGTSCATPYAAGVAALIKSKNPTLTPAEVRFYLTSTTTDIIDEEPTPGWDRYTGYGMVNADDAVGAVISSPLFPPTNLTVDEANGQFTWDAPSSVDPIGYNVYLDGEQEGNTIDTEWQFTDLINGTTYEAGVVAVYDEGESVMVTIDFVPNIVSAGNEIFTTTALISNYPNPFNPTTTISFSLATESAENTELIIYNLRGQKVKTLVNEKLDIGIHQVVWNGDDKNGKPISSGLYFYKLKSGSLEQTKKMILLK